MSAGYASYSLFRGALLLVPLVKKPTLKIRILFDSKKGGFPLLKTRFSRKKGSGKLSSIVCQHVWVSQRFSLMWECLKFRNHCFQQNATIYVVLKSAVSLAGVLISRWCWSQKPGYDGLWSPSWTDGYIWPRFHAVDESMPDKMNFNRLYLKPLHCEFQTYEVMTMSVVGSQPKTKKKHANPIYEATNHTERIFLISDY